MQKIGMAFENESSLEMLSEAFLTELEKIRQLVDDVEFEDDLTEDDEEEESEYAEVYGDLKDGMKKYHEKFKAYAEELRQAVEQAYGGEKHTKESKANEKKERVEEHMKTPWERGHKLGCGCPGCTAYREFYGIKLNEGQNYMGGAGAAAMKTTEARKEAPKYEETTSKPCKGRLYNFFHGERADLKSVLGQYTKKFNFGRIGY